MKVLVIVNAIISAGSNIAAALSDSGGAGNDVIQKSMDSLRSVLLPHMEDEKESKAELAKKILTEEYEKGEIKFKVVGGKKKKPGSIRLSRKDL